MTRRTSRRMLFSSAALLATLPSFARPHGPDHRLIALCGDFIAECDRYDREAEAAGDDDARRTREAYATQAEWRRQVDGLERLHAITAEGIQARALALHRLNGRGEYSYECDDQVPARMLACLLRDAAALGGAV